MPQASKNSIPTVEYLDELEEKYGLAINGDIDQAKLEGWYDWIIDARAQPYRARVVNTFMKRNHDSRHKTITCHFPKKSAQLVSEKDELYVNRAESQ